MPRPAKRIRTATETAAAPSSTMHAFTRVSKNNALHAPAAKKILESTTSANKKRKVSCIDIDDKVTLAPHQLTTTSSEGDVEIQLPKKRACRRPQEPALVTPVAPVSAASTPATAPTPAKTAPKGKTTARASMSRAQTAHKPSETTVLGKSRQTKRTIQTKIDGFGKKPKKDNEFTGDLADLVSLHQAFVNTILMQFAHNGTASPIHFHTLAPHVTRAWGKRQVSMEDIRRCIAVQACAQNGQTLPFIVSDYGRGQVCIELAPDQDTTTIRQDQLCQQFKDNLRRIAADRAADEMADVDISLGTLSIADLPQAAVAHRPMGMSNPAIGKGQRALAELKNGIEAQRQQEDASRATLASMRNADGSKMSLLDRLRAKQIAREQGPAPPSAAELERQAALSRAPDVATTLYMLSLSKPAGLPRQAFTMQAVLDSLRDSLRTPISKDEATGALKVIAAEVAPEWLRVVAIGGRENVVLQRRQQPTERVIRERVAKLLG
ncbi:uncharacterized protein J7T54_003465 [Emericellopsis cladophorae]|uniref:DNA replication factor Cdt1 C-terminal domain-containing protein n=1 Tax=Emericellopsis cladophorae TaxID=2686198 RepID=A0A9Q0BEN2_9HYPO|nr:uncharacterized protein J7T54_003465 [Emericellopsis cladophorae]KAI6782046.1 hypothetical protein J7T54_003465 [Emericellopsis cladophorae]